MKRPKIISSAPLCATICKPDVLENIQEHISLAKRSVVRSVEIPKKVVGFT